MFCSEYTCERTPVTCNRQMNVLQRVLDICFEYAAGHEWRNSFPFKKCKLKAGPRAYKCCILQSLFRMLNAFGVRLHASLITTATSRESEKNSALKTDCFAPSLSV